MHKQYRWILVLREPIKRLAKLNLIVQLLARTLPLDHPIPDRAVPLSCIMHFGTLIVCRPRRPRGRGRPPSVRIMSLRSSFPNYAGLRGPAHSFARSGVRRLRPHLLRVFGDAMGDRPENDGSVTQVRAGFRV